MEPQPQEFTSFLQTFMKGFSVPFDGDTSTNKTNNISNFLGEASNVLATTSSLVETLSDKIKILEDVEILLVFTLSILTNKEDAVLLGSSVKGLVETQKEYLDLFKKSQFYDDIMEGYNSTNK